MVLALASVFRGFCRLLLLLLKTKVIRYYPYYEMAIKLMKRLMLEQSNLDDEAKSTISKPDAGLAELHAAVGHDHWVVTPCERASLVPGARDRIMEG